jgi:hypothetical protein
MEAYVSDVWDEYKCEEFTLHGMLFTTINDNIGLRAKATWRPY